MQAVFDAHVDTLMRVTGPGQFINGNDRTHLDVPRAVGAGVTHLVTAICSEPEKDPESAFDRGYANWVDCREASPIRLLLMVEGCRQLLDSMMRGKIMDQLSVASLTWNGRNGLAGGIGTDEGLTEEGRELAEELHRRGVVLDVSHLCDRSRRELISMGIPTVATHCNCRALHDVPRNLPDDDIRAIAGSGGVVGVTFVPSFLGDNASIEDIVRHLEHVAEVAGVETAGFGSDFDGIARLPRGVDDCGVWPGIIGTLDARGWSEEDINAVACENWKRAIPTS